MEQESHASEPVENPASESQQPSRDNASAPKPINPIVNPIARQPKPMTFGRTMLASALGFLISFVVINVLAFVVCIGMVVAMVAAIASSDAPVPIVGDQLFVRLDLTKPLAENNPSELQSIMSQDDAVSLHTLLKAVAHAKDDSCVAGLYLYMGDGGTLTWAQSDELRGAVLDFRTSGKPVVAYGNAYTQPAYYLASAANTVMLNPAGMVDFRGLAAESIFLKDLLAKFDIGVDLIRPNSNAFKSAGETYTMNRYSDANREQVRAYLQGIWNHVLDGVAHERGIDADSLSYIADNLEGMLGREAVLCGIVDTLAFENDARQTIKEKLGGKRIVGATRYAKNIASPSRADRIAVVYAEGNVVGGSSDGFSSNAYCNDFVKAMDDAARDANVKAIVLRINSPGGSALASEAMTDAVVRAKAKKPVIVSMGGVAASAGYEIASNASYIVAQPITLTGSIGVFGVVPEVGTFLRKRLGITTDTVLTAANAAGLSPMRPLSPAARAMMQRNVEDFYVNFCLRVAQGRSLDVEYVDSIARGRVWLGREALRIGLVDTLGGMDVAMSVAAREAKLDAYSVVTYPAPKDMMTQLMEAVGESRERDIDLRLKEMLPIYDELRYWRDMEPLQARLPFVLNID